MQCLLISFLTVNKALKAIILDDELTIAIDHDTYQPVTMLFHPGAVYGSKVFAEILHELKRRRIIMK